MITLTLRRQGRRSADDINRAAEPFGSWLMATSRSITQTAQEILFAIPRCACGRKLPKPKHIGSGCFDRGDFLPDNGQRASQCR